MTRTDLATQILLAFIREGAAGREMAKHLDPVPDRFAHIAADCFALADAMLAAGTPTEQETGLPEMSTCDKCRSTMPRVIFASHLPWCETASKLDAQLRGMVSPATATPAPTREEPAATADASWRAASAAPRATEMGEP